MQDRHKNRTLYFHELVRTSERHFVPYIGRFKRIGKGGRVLEIGCGDGGNLLPFAQMGCYTMGVDVAEGRIADARRFFEESGAKGDFIASDIFLLKEQIGTFDLIICHDVIEHIADKQRLLSLLSQLLKEGGVAFVSFPAWQMPFGGHQQICRSRTVSHLPFIHLLPTRLYRALLRAAGESNDCISELMRIRETRTLIELFEQTVGLTPQLRIIDRTLWLVNPHYETKFGLRPRLLPRWLASVPRVRNFFTTSCFYVLACNERANG